MKEHLKSVILYVKENAAVINKLSNFFFAYAVYLAVAIFGALWSLMKYAAIDADTAMDVINADIYSLALFLSIFLILAYGFGKLIEWVMGLEFFNS